MLYRGLTVVALAGVCFCLTGCPSSSGDGDGVSLQQRYADAQAIVSPNVRASALIDVARDQHIAGDVNGATQSLSDAFAAAGETDDAVAKSHAFNTLAAAQAEFGSKSGADDALKEARKAASGIGDALIRSEQLGMIAVTYGAKLDEPNKATAYLKQANDAIGDILGEQLKSEATIALAYSYHQVGDADQAKQLTEDATELANSIADPGSRADALANI